MKEFACERWLLACALTLWAISAHAVGIDCSKAKTKVEHLICDDVAVDQLDIDLSIAYQSAVDKAVDPAVVVRSQRDWLRQRNVCSDTTCLAQAYRSRMEALKQVKPAGWKTYHDPNLGISFDYLENRRIEACQGRTDERCVALVGRDMAGSDYLIAFKRVDGPLEKVASEEAGFVQNDGGRWVTSYGRAMPVEVESFSGHGWKGMRATIACGINDEAGFHAIAGECFWAVMSDGKRSIVADSQPTAGNDADTQRSVNSLRFDP